MKNYSLRFIIGIVCVLIVLIFTKIKSDATNKENTVLQGKVSYLQKALEQSPTITWVKDSDLILIDFNESFVKYFLEPMGLQRDDYINKNDFAVWDSAIAREFRRVDRLSISCECPIPQDITVPYKTDTLRFVGIKYPYYFDNGSVGSAGEFKLVISEK